MGVGWGCMYGLKLNPNLTNRQMKGRREGGGGLGEGRGREGNGTEYEERNGAERSRMELGGDERDEKGWGKR